MPKFAAKLPRLPSFASPVMMRCSENHISPAWYTKHWYDSTEAKSVPLVGIIMAQKLPSVPMTATKFIRSRLNFPSPPKVMYSTAKIIRLHRWNGRHSGSRCMPPPALSSRLLMTLLTSLSAQIAVIIYPARRRVRSFLRLTRHIPITNTAHRPIQIKCSAVNIAIPPCQLMVRLSYFRADMSSRESLRFVSGRQHYHSKFGITRQKSPGKVQSMGQKLS